MYLVPDSDFQVVYLTPSNIEDCLVWKPKRESPNPAKAANTCVTDYDSSSCIVGRFPEHPHILPGNFAAIDVNAVMNDKRVYSSSGESLDVQPGCMVTWLSFTGGEPIPEGAVAGGYLDDGGNQQPLYIMSAVQPEKNCAVYGYYDPTTARGYVEYYGVFEYAQMNLLILYGWNWVTLEALTWPALCPDIYTEIYIVSDKVCGICSRGEVYAYGSSSFVELPSDL